ncbi:MAG: response regulator [Opitutales bacterium]|nr:response regulator [Opitutales bacterium]
MNKHILIVDDEPQFNVLLSEVYRQAGYGVTAVGTAMEGLAVLQREAVDLVVTDYRMPGMTGLEFIQEVRAKDTETPIIMVSGYLESSTVRELIANGVGGVFSKPMNVFSLLSKTSELLGDNVAPTKAEGHGAPAAGDSPGREEPSGKADGGESESKGKVRAPHAFWLFPGKSPQSEAFVRKAKGFTGFSRALSIVGEAGTDFARLCDAFVGADRREAPPVYLGPEDLDRSALNGAVRGRRAEGYARATVVVREAEKLTETQRCTLYAWMDGVDKGTADFEARLIFLFPKPVDTLYDEGAVDEDFYVFLGANEMSVPPLRVIREDIELLAQDRLGAMVPGVVLDDSAVAFLRELPFERNEEELDERLRAAVERCGGTRLTRGHFETEWAAGAAAGGGSGAGLLEQRLRRRRAEALGAAMLLSGGDAKLAAQWLKVNPDVFGTVTKDEE